MSPTASRMPAETTTHATPSIPTRKPMPARRTPHATPFSDPRNTMHTETAQDTVSRPSHIRSLRPVHVARPDHAEELRASRIVPVATEELGWFFTSTDTDGPALHARATIEGWLGALDSAARRTLALRFDPTPWPEPMQAEGLESGYALVVSLVSTETWYAGSGLHHERHRSASDQLEAAVRERGLAVMRGIRRRADWDFANAVRAYTKARGRAPSALAQVASARCEEARCR